MPTPLASPYLSSICANCISSQLLSPNKSAVNFVAITALSQLAYAPTSEIGILARISHNLFDVGVCCYLLKLQLNYFGCQIAKIFRSFSIPGSNPIDLKLPFPTLVTQQHEPLPNNMNPLQKTLNIVAAIALTSTAVWFIHSMIKSPTFPEQWAVMEVTDAQTMTLRQTDGNQMQVHLCGIDAAELANQAKQKLRSLVAIDGNQVTVIPVAKDEQGRTVAEVMAYGKDGVEVSFGEELLKSGLVKTRQSGVECPNQIAFENAQRLAVASKAGIWGQLK